MIIMPKNLFCFQCMTEAGRKPLYPGCTKYTKLIVVITLFNIKTKGDISYSSFTFLLQTFCDILPNNHELSKSNYYAKKLMCPFDLEYQMIHVCPNKCVLYRYENENLDEFPRCGKSYYVAVLYEESKKKISSASMLTWTVPTKLLMIVAKIK